MEQADRVSTLSDPYAAALAGPPRQERPLVAARLHWLLLLLLVSGLAFWTAVVLAVVAVVG